MSSTVKKKLIKANVNELEAKADMVIKQIKFCSTGIH